MTNWIDVALMLFLMTIKLPSISSWRHVIKVQRNWIDLGSVMGEAAVNSADECISLCSNTMGCGSSMLLGRRCILHGRLCQCPDDAIRPQSNMPSCYKIVKQPRIDDDDAWQSARKDCAGHGMHLLAINSAAEQELMEEILEEHAPECDRIFISAYSPISGSKIMSDWRWVITPYHSQPLTYFNWHPGQPDNYGGTGNHVVALVKAWGNYEWSDVTRGSKATKQFCHICECTSSGCD